MTAPLNDLGPAKPSMALRDEELRTTRCSAPTRLDSLSVLHVAKVKDNVGGVERHLLDLLPGLQDRGLNIHICVATERAHGSDGLIDTFRDAGIPVSPLTIRGHADPAVVLRLAGMIPRFDIVHTHMAHAEHHTALAAIVRSRHDPRLVTTVHAPRVEDGPAARIAMRILSRRYDACIAISAVAARAARDVLGFDHRKVSIINYGVSVPATGGLLTRPGCTPFREILVHSRLAATKHIEDVVRAFDRAAVTGARLRIAGEGPSRSQIEEAISQTSRPAEITLLGEVLDVWPLLRDADAWVSMSSTEGFGLALAEALAAGLPIVCSDLPAHREVAGEAALYVRVGDVAGAAAALTRLAQDRALRQRLSLAAHARGRELSLSRMLDRTLAVYRNVHTPSAS